MRDRRPVKGEFLPVTLWLLGNETPDVTNEELVFVIKSKWVDRFFYLFIYFKRTKLNRRLKIECRINSFG